jgi:uncharacterized protein
MKISKDELNKVLSQFNPWWRSEEISDLPSWKRPPFNELFTWTYNPPAPRAVFLSGARQVGKTTLLLQTIKELLAKGVAAGNILYATFDHPIIKLAGIELTLETWREREPKKAGIEYIFLDEAQFISNWGTWVKHQVDFVKDRKITFTGSSMPLLKKGQESGVGRWHTISLTTLSFCEYLQIKQSLSEEISLGMVPLGAPPFAPSPALLQKINSSGKSLAELFNLHVLPKLPELPKLNTLHSLFDWSPQEFQRVAQLAAPYMVQFHEYLLRGGFPQTAKVESITQAQRLLREDIVDKVLKRDMTAVFGVRRVLELERTFLYLCMHDGGLLDMQTLSNNLGVSRTTAEHFIELLEASHLIYRLPPFGYGKNILRAKYKVYLADAAIAPAVLLQGKGLLDDPDSLGIAVEAALFKHLFSYSYQHGIRFSYWQGKDKKEVDVIAEIGEKIVPFEIKYRAHHTNAQDFKGLIELCRSKKIEYGYLVTKSLDDFGLLENANIAKTSARIMRIPAALLCYWLGESVPFE